jgi:hypothetical protein
MFFRCSSVYELCPFCALEIGYLILSDATSLKLSTLTKFEAEFWSALFVLMFYLKCIIKGLTVMSIP